jgi:Rrf2 family protein
VRISAKSDYAVRAMLELALAADLLPCDAVATAQGIPVTFLRNVIMIDLKRAGLVASTRGSEGGYRLNRPATDITVADIIRAVDGPMATVQGVQPHDVAYAGTAEILQPLWVAVRASLRAVLENVHLADLAAGALPASVAGLLEDPEAWRTHTQ